MKPFHAFLVIISLVFSLARISANPAAQSVVGRTIYHADNSRTESVRDPNTRELSESTYDANGVLTTRKVFLLNERGDPVQGNVYDGRGNLVARAQTIYDEFGRRKEVRMFNLRGEVFQQVIHEYGGDGKALPPRVINDNSKAPTMRTGVIDFTRSAGPVSDPQAGQQRFAPMVVPDGSAGANPQLPPVYAPGADPNAGATQPEPPKKSFWKRLFSKKEKNP